MQKIIWYLDLCHKFFSKPRNQLYATIALVIFGFLGIATVNWALNSKEVSVINREKQTSEKTREVRVTLIVNDGINTTEYSHRLKNTESVERFLSRLRSDYEFEYEKIDYRNRSEISRVGNVKASENYKWIMTMNNVDITNALGSTKFEDKNSDERTLFLTLTYVDSPAN